jgi:hypothetical protein
VTRWWTDLVAAVSDMIPLPLLLLTMIVAALIVGALWYFFPAWVPRRLPRLPRLRRPRWRWQIKWPSWRWRRPRWHWPGLRGIAGRLLAWLLALLRALRWPGRRRGAEEPAESIVEELVLAAGDALPDLPADTLASLADRLAAQGRYAEAIRERLRAMVRLLVERGVIEDRPGWTVTELSAAAGLALPAVAPPLREAATVFSDVWYAQRPATADLDARMRALAQQLQLDRRPVWAAATGGSR